MINNIPECSIKFREVPKGSGVFQEVPGCSQVFRGIPVCSGHVTCGAVGVAKAKKLLHSPLLKRRRPRRLKFLDFFTGIG
jgi:hypothetical protein